MGNKSGRRNSKVRCRGGKRSGGDAGPMPGRSSYKKKLKRVVRKISLGIQRFVAPDPIVGHADDTERNAPCSCGSGEKSKRCCGR